MIFIMNRTKAGWKSWFTEPLPNIGLFLCRGNNKTVQVFDISWQKYLNMEDDLAKANPGKDQNHVLDAMRIGRGTFALKYAYFSNNTAPLLDKAVLKQGLQLELGGEIMQNFLEEHHSIAMHATCYEKSTKVMGMKASSAFWNPRYYDPRQPTITKQILYFDDRQLLEEVRSLVWLAMSTHRAVIIPNILGPDEYHTVTNYRGQAMWPGFRVIYLKRSKGRSELNVQILEPNFYWRVQRDYSQIPPPTIVYYRRDENLLQVKERLERVSHLPRVILQSTHLLESVITAGNHPQLQVDRERLSIWANDSIGLFHDKYTVLAKEYLPVPSLKSIRFHQGVKYVYEVFQGMRNCARIFNPPTGNRTCFQVCD